MTLSVRWVPAAVEEMQVGHDWYDERQPGLGREFVVEVFKARDHALKFPHAFKRYEHVRLPAMPEIRKAQLERFTEYGVVFAVVGDTFWVLAVAHAKRRPGYWAPRVTDVSP